MKIGLFGGSFNPPHSGHVHISHIALRRLGLDQLWWSVSPGNPLKNNHNLLPLPQRLKLCQELVDHPAVRITAFEARFNVRYTADTLEVLTTRRPCVNFVWVMGADNLTDFHKWDRWRNIADRVPLAVIDRPGSTMSPNSTSATSSLSRFRVDERDGQLLAGAKPPAWTFIHGPRSFLSSTQIRNSK
ncbi:MAG: nicotinate-nucleotide adenylyltransferase [Rhizobiaceae bacterium]|nr:nicotinate-nucleotide adenylyltransferase [Rhizobiaceae bacterium]